MIDDRELLEQAMRRFVPEAGLADRVMQRRERKRRNQRIAAVSVGVGVVLAVAIALGARALFAPIPADEPTPAGRVGFIGLPPEGAEPSTPATGELVLSLDTTVSGGMPFKTTLQAYADGRLIWERHEADTGVPEGATDRNTGYLEQRLTPEGVETLRAMVLATGLFDQDLHLRGGYEANPELYGTRISVLGEDGLVSLSWAAGYEDDRHPTDNEITAIRGLLQRLVAPEAWLPDTAWADREIRAYVASTYGINFSLVEDPNGDCCLRPDPPSLPPPAEELLKPKLNQCLTTEEARRLAEGFEAAGMIGSPAGSFAPGGLSFEVAGPPVTGGETQFMVLSPNLPDRTC